MAWIAWAASLAISRWPALANPVLSAVAQSTFLLGVFAPSLVAIALTERTQGRTGTRALVGQIFKWRVGAPWYVFAIGYIAAIKLLVALMYRIAIGAWRRFGEEPWLVLRASIIRGRLTDGGNFR